MEVVQTRKIIMILFDDTGYFSTGKEEEEGDVSQA